MVAAKRDCSSLRTTLPTQRRRTSARVPGALGSVIRYSIDEPTSTGTLDVNSTPQELTLWVSPLALFLTLARNDLEGKTQVEALMFSLFRHSDTEFIEWNI